MVVCAAIGCFQRTDRRKAKDIVKGKITFHRFPNNPTLRIKWIQAVKRNKDWLPGKRDTLCSLHFTEDCFNRTLTVTRLRENVTPTLFSSTSSERHLQQEQNKSQLKVKEPAEESIESDPSTSSSTENDQPCIQEFVFIKEEPLY